MQIYSLYIQVTNNSLKFFPCKKFTTLQCNVDAILSAIPTRIYVIKEKNANTACLLRLPIRSEEHFEYYVHVFLNCIHLKHCQVLLTNN